MFASWSGLEDAQRRLDALPAHLLARLETKGRALADALAAKVRDEKLSGQALETRTGALKASILADVAVDGDGVVATVGSFGDVKYAAIQEYGGQTSPHEILPQKAQALAFVSGGALRFARRVEHPGSKLPARAYLASSLEEMSEDIVAELGGAVAEAWSA